MTTTISPSLAISEYLQSPDDLLKIPAYRKKLEKEKASLDSRLKSGIKEQVQFTKDGLRKLLGTRATVQAVKDEMINVERECGDESREVAGFDVISRVSMVHRNFQQTEEMVNNLLEMDSKITMIESMLELDSRNVVGPAPNLLVIHYLLNQLEAFRNQTMHEAKKSSSAKTRAELTRWFERLDGVIEAFDEYIVVLAENVLNLVRTGNQDVVVKLIKIAEIEGKEDEKAIAIRLLKKAAYKLDAAAKFKSMQANARVIKHYRSKITRSITQSIKRKFEAAYTKDQAHPQDFLDGLTWMYQDIIRIQEDVVPCFPAEYEIYSLFIREYHKALNNTLKKLVDSEPGASVLLALFEWLKEYKASMKELAIPPDLLEPPLLDGKEQNLIEDYLQVIVKKLEEWTANLMKTEIEEFTARKDPPEVDADGLYGPQGGAPILFQMVNQQIDLAMESGQGAILARVVSEVNRVIRGMQEQWSRTIDSEYRKQIDKPEEVPGGLVEYLIALANDTIKCADYTEALLARLEPLVSEKYRITINERLNDVIDGYLDVAKRCTQTLIDVIFNDVKAATKMLFQAGWYEDDIGQAAGGGAVMVQVVETMKDYMSDYQVSLNSSVLELLVEDLLIALLLNYLNALANSPKLRIPAATNQIRSDVSTLFSFFTTLKPAKELESYFEVIELILGILEASKDFIFMSFYAFAKVHGPNLAFVEGLIRARGDLDRKEAGEVIDSVKRKIRDEGIGDPMEPTIMKKVSIQNSFSRFLHI